MLLSNCQNIRTNYALIYNNRVASKRNGYVLNVIRAVSRVKVNTLYKPMVRKLIIMVIDALRWDFLATPMGNLAMPVTTNLVMNSSGCLLKAKLQSPTVTMPRIKVK